MCQNQGARAFAAPLCWAPNYETNVSWSWDLSKNDWLQRRTGLHPLQDPTSSSFPMSQPPHFQQQDKWLRQKHKQLGLRTHLSVYWLVVWIPLKILVKLNQLGWLLPMCGTIKHVPNHQPVYKFTSPSPLCHDFSLPFFGIPAAVFKWRQTQDTGMSSHAQSLGQVYAWFGWLWLFRYFNYMVVSRMGVSQNGWLIVEIPIKMDDLAAPLF